MKKKKQSKELAKPRKPALRTGISPRGTAFGLPIPTTAQHKTAVKAMAPYIEEFQRAADEQTRKDLGVGVIGKTTHIITPRALHERVTKKRKRKE